MKWREQSLFLIFSIGVLSGLFASVFAQDTSYELAFSNGNIFTVDTVSGTATQLTDGDRYSDSPTWSPDGTQIAFVQPLTDDFYGQYGLFVMNADGGHLAQIASDLVWRSQPVWLKSGVSLLYATRSGIKDGDCLIRSVLRDGSESQTIYRQGHTNCNVSALSPQLSPDNTQILFGLDDPVGKYFQLYSMSLVNQQVKQLTHNRNDNGAAEWSPDGTQIAFNAIQDSQREIFVMDADGNNLRRVTHRPGNDYAPHWLADGKSLIFSSDQKGYNIFSVELATGIVRNLTNLTDSGAWNPVVSPDGTQIAYPTGVDPVGGADHINVLTLATGEVHELTGVGATAYSLAWRPLEK